MVIPFNPRPGYGPVIKQMYKFSGSAVQLNNVGGLLFADDFVDMSDSSENLQKVIDVVHKFCNRKANVSKCAIVVLSKSTVDRKSVV